MAFNVFIFPCKLLKACIFIYFFAKWIICNFSKKLDYLTSWLILWICNRGQVVCGSCNFSKMEICDIYTEMWNLASLWPSVFMESIMSRFKTHKHIENIKLSCILTKRTTDERWIADKTCPKWWRFFSASSSTSPGLSGARCQISVQKCPATCSHLWKIEKYGHHIMTAFFFFLRREKTENYWNF